MDLGLLTILLDLSLSAVTFTDAKVTKKARIMKPQLSSLITFLLLLGHDFSLKSNLCHESYGDEAWRVNGKGKRWMDGIDIFHYSRSVEKYALKQKTWKTSSGEVKPGQTAEDAAKNYDISGFLHRSVGWTHESTALRYSCQVREVLRQVTGEKIFLRHGDFWYRNPEFGKAVNDPDKRGRYGRANPDGFKYSEFNPYHYFGEGYLGGFTEGATQTRLSDVM